MKFLLDANLSPKTADFLRKSDHNVKSLIEEGLGQISDKEVVKIAALENRIIITHDLDFGEIYYFKESEDIGIIVLRLNNQTVESTNRALNNFFENKKITEDKMKKSLVVISETRYRIYKG